MPYNFLPDTSVLVNGKILDYIEDGTLMNYRPTEHLQPMEGDQLEIVLSRIVLAEIENQANHTKACGSFSIEIIEDLYKLVKDHKIMIRVCGKRPSWDELRMNPGGELDALIRRDAQEEGAILVTADNIQATMALVEGIEVLYVQNLPEGIGGLDDKKLHKIQDFFDDTTMSVHLRAHCVPLAKRGRPGEWQLEPIGDEILDPTELGEISARIILRSQIG